MSDGKRWNAQRASPAVHRGRAGCRPAGWRDDLLLAAYRDHAGTAGWRAGRLVASSFDTSVAMIEKTYSKFIADHGDAQMRRALFDVDAPADGNVVPLVR